MEAAPTLGFNGETFLKRSLEAPLGENERAQKWPRLNGCLSTGETIFDGEELVDGTGGSKGEKQDASPEPLSPSQESPEDRVEEKESALKEEEAHSEQTQSVETRVEETEVQPDDSVEDLIRKGKEIFIQGFNWESHKQQWWSSLKEKVPEFAAWGVTSMWLPPICDSLAPQGWIDAHQEQLRNKRVLMYCTGGVQCELASSYLRSEGKEFEDVIQLSGGIHRYMEAFADGGYFKGKNFVFITGGFRGRWLLRYAVTELAWCLTSGLSSTYSF